MIDCQTLATVLTHAGFPPPTLEFHFHPSRKWRFDLAWPDYKVAVERQGGVWVGGRHNRGAGLTGDCEKFTEGALLGWLILLATPEQIERGMLFGWLDRALKERGWRP